MNVLKLKTTLTRVWSTAFLAIALTTGVAQAASIELTSFTGNQATIVGEGFSKGSQSSFQVNFYVDGNFLADINTNENGSFSYTTPAGKVSSGDSIEVKVLNWNGSGQHWSKSVRVSSGGGSQPRPQPQPQPEPTFHMPEAKLRDYADQQARTVANRVVKTYGELEKWKYNFAVGYWLGLTNFANSYESRVMESNGRAAGGDRGTNEGYAAGNNRASSVASSAANSAAVARFRAILNTSTAPDTSLPNISIPEFGGVSASETACNSTNSRSQELESELSREMRSLAFCVSNGDCLVYDGTAYSIRFENLNRWNQNSYQFVDSWFRIDYAWSEWMNNDLGGRYDHVNYNKLDGEQRSDFKRYFASVYDNVIDEKYTRKKTEYNSTARSRGEWYGYQIGARKAYDRGCNDAYSDNYTPASIRGYNEGYVSFYTNTFKSTAYRYNSAPVVAIDGIRLIDGNQNGVFELGEKIGIVVGNVTNLGRVAARNLPMTMSGDGLDALANQQNISIEPSTSVAVNQVAMDLAEIRMDVLADRTNVVTVKVGSNSQQLSYIVSWKGSIQALAKASPSQATSLKQFVLKNIQDEYTSNEKAKNDIYSAKEVQTSKLRDLVEFYETLPQNERANILSMGATIVKMQEVHENNKWSTGKLRKNFAALAGRIK